MSKLSIQYVGIIQSLVEEFETHRLPRLLGLKDKVDNGEMISDADIAFLDKEINDVNRTMHMTVNHPELHVFCVHVVHLYKQISEKALENETK